MRISPAPFSPIWVWSTWSNLPCYAPRLSNASIRSYYMRPPYVTEWTTPAGADVLLPVQDQLEPLLVQAMSLSNAAVQRQGISVEVQNGTTLSGVDGLAANRLNYAGYVTHISPADAQNHQASVLVDTTESQDSAARAALLDVLGLGLRHRDLTTESGCVYQLSADLGQRLSSVLSPRGLAALVDNIPQFR